MGVCKFRQRRTPFNMFNAKSYIVEYDGIEQRSKIEGQDYLSYSALACRFLGSLLCFPRLANAPS
jgi:hypothetical protein